MDNKKIATELVKMAKSLTAGGVIKEYAVPDAFGMVYVEWTIVLKGNTSFKDVNKANANIANSIKRDVSQIKKIGKLKAGLYGIKVISWKGDIVLSESLSFQPYNPQEVTDVLEKIGFRFRS